MSFALRRDEETAVVAYVMRDAAREDAGLFTVPESRNYCLRWDPVDRNAPWPTLLRFELRLTGTAEK